MKVSKALQMFDLEMVRGSKTDKTRFQFKKIHMEYEFVGLKRNLTGDNLVFQDVTGLHISI